MWPPGHARETSHLAYDALHAPFVDRGVAGHIGSRRMARARRYAMSSPAAPTSSLRGAPVAGDGRRLGRIVAWVLVAGIIIIGVVMVGAKVVDNDRAVRLHSSGIPVSARVTYCLGQLGGSGTNAVGFACKATYKVAGTTYNEPVGGMSTFAPPGSTMAGVVDPQNHTVLVTKASASSTTSTTAGLLFPVLVIVAGIVLAGILLVTRRRSAGEAPASPSP